jgi:hypothetical protein
VLVKLRLDRALTAQDLLVMETYTVKPHKQWQYKLAGEKIERAGRAVNAGARRVVLCCDAHSFLGDT